MEKYFYLFTPFMLGKIFKLCISDAKSNEKRLKRNVLPSVNLPVILTQQRISTPVKMKKRKRAERARRRRLSFR